jgi:hypothetical protein
MPPKKLLPPTPAKGLDRLSTAKSLDEVVDNFDRIVKWAIAAPSRIGYFATIYKRSTIAIPSRLRNLVDWIAEEESQDVALNVRTLDVNHGALNRAFFVPPVSGRRRRRAWCLLR